MATGDWDYNHSIANDQNITITTPHDDTIFIDDGFGRTKKRVSLDEVMGGRISEIEALLGICLACGAEGQLLCDFCRESIKHGRKVLMEDILDSIRELKEGTDEISSGNDL